MNPIIERILVIAIILVIIFVLVWLLGKLRPSARKDSFKYIIPPTDEGDSFELGGQHGSTPLVYIIPLVARDGGYTDGRYFIAHAAKYTNTLFIYNDDQDRFLKGSLSSNGGGNAFLREHRIDVKREPGSISTLGVPTDGSLRSMTLAIMRIKYIIDTYATKETPLNIVYWTNGYETAECTPIDVKATVPTAPTLGLSTFKGDPIPARNSVLFVTALNYILSGVHYRWYTSVTAVPVSAQRMEAMSTFSMPAPRRSDWNNQTIVSTEATLREIDSENGKLSIEDESWLTVGVPEMTVTNDTDFVILFDVLAKQSASLILGKRIVYSASYVPSRVHQQR